MASGGTNVQVKSIKVTYISTKTDKFDNTICYFKVTGFNNKKLLCPILSECCDECRISIWITEDGEYMLKVKHKYAPKFLVAGTDSTVLLTFKYYCMEVMDGVLNQGYYAQMKVMSKPDAESDD